MSLFRKIDAQLHTGYCFLGRGNCASLSFTLHHLKYTALSIYNSQKQI